MTPHPEIPFLREGIVFLGVAGLLIPLLQRLHVNQIFGFLIAGALLGPFGVTSFVYEQPLLAWIAFPSREDVAGLAELGVIFLMFSIGLEMSLARLASMRHWVFGAGSAQLLLTAAAIGGIAFAFGNRLGDAAIVGFAFAFSSTAVVMQLLAHRGQLGTPLGQASFSVLLLQDLAVAPVLVLVAVIARGEDPLTAASLAAVKAVVAIAAIYAVGRWLLRPLFRQLVVPGQPESLVALTVGATMVIAISTQAAGLSPALGALLAGVLLAETEFHHEIELTLAPFRGLLLGLFFFSVGMGFDFRALAAEPLLLPISVIGLFALKALVLAAVLRYAGLAPGAAVEGGLLLGQAGEFSFVVLGAAMAAGALESGVGSFMLLVVGLSLFATPPMARFATWAGAMVDRRYGLASEPPSTPSSDPPRVVVVGFGRVGLLLANLLQRERIPFLGIDASPRVAGRHRVSGIPLHFGDASRLDLLRRCGLEHAQVLVLTIDRPELAVRIVETARRAFPQLRIVARALDEAHARRLRDAGADAALPETLESALRLGSLVLSELGVPEDAIAAVVGDERERRLLDSSATRDRRPDPGGAESDAADSGDGAAR